MEDVFRKTGEKRRAVGKWLCVRGKVWGKRDAVGKQDCAKRFFFMRKRMQGEFGWEGEATQRRENVGEKRRSRRGKQRGETERGRFAVIPHGLCRYQKGQVGACDAA